MDQVERIWAVVNEYSGAIQLAGAAASAVIFWIYRNTVIRLFTRRSTRRKRISGLAGTTSRIKAQSVPGLTSLTLQTLVSVPEVRQTFHLVSQEGGSFTDEIFFEAIRECKRARDGLIIAPAGHGKSLLALYLFIYLYEHYVQGFFEKVPVWVDLSLLEEQPAANDKDWLDKYLKLFISKEEEYDKDEHYLIVDGVDEYLSSLPLAQRERHPIPLIQLADIATVRSEFFDEYLDGRKIISRFEVITIKAWTNVEEAKYIEAVSRRKEIALSLKGQKLIDAFATARQFLSFSLSPLQVNMLLEIVGREDVLGHAPDSLVALYGRYIRLVTRSENEKAGGLLSLEHKLELLASIAWAHYSEDFSSKLSLTRSSIEKIIGQFIESDARFVDLHSYSLSVITADLLERSIFRRQQMADLEGVRSSYKFQHKSFHDYLVARYIHESGPERMHRERIFSSVFSHTVSEFLKEFYQSHRASPDSARALADNLYEVYKRAKARAPTATRRRIEIQQIAYYLGSVPTIVARKKLERIICNEEDVWVRRGARIGLAFSGDPNAINDYITALRSERADRDNTQNESDVNIGYHLSFFGDQAVDIEAPEVDSGVPTCTKTIEGLIHQLTTEIDRPNWRLNLYTMIDLAINRPQSRHSYIKVIGERRAELLAVLDKLSRDVECKNWVEIEEMRMLLGNIAKFGALALFTSSQANKDEDMKNTAPTAIIIENEELQRFEEENISGILLPATTHTSSSIAVIAPGEQQTPHTQDRPDSGAEVIFVFEGEFEFYRGKECVLEHNASEGGPVYISIPSGVETYFKNTGKVALKMFTVFAPPFELGEIHFAGSR